MSDWISAREALRRAKEAGVSEGDLMEWAEAGQLRSQAGLGRFSDDEEDVERVLRLPETQSEREAEILKRVTLGEPWPDVPRDFWHWMNASSARSTARWASGVFATMVIYENAPYHGSDSQYIKLLDVEFHVGDLTGLLGTSGAAPQRAKLPETAKPNDRLYEEAAHVAAELVRSEKIKKSEAFRRALREMQAPITTEQASRERAVRRTYDLMYNELGLPAKNDPN